MKVSLYDVDLRYRGIECVIEDSEYVCGQGRNLTKEGTRKGRKRVNTSSDLICVKLTQINKILTQWASILPNGNKPGQY